MEQTTVKRKKTRSASYDTKRPAKARLEPYDTKKTAKPITLAEYSGFQRAYDFFNRELFENSLPQLLIVLQRRGHTLGYFSPDRFSGRNSEGMTDELALNPDKFTARSDKDILGTLNHEMCHVWQNYHGRPPRRGYHNREWATKMKEIGLQPSNIGQPGGKETGQRMDHYIVEGGSYEQAYQRLLKDGFQLNWQSAPPPEKPQRDSKTKFTCPNCAQNVWGKPDAHVICGDCRVTMPQAA